MSVAILPTRPVRFRSGCVWSTPCLVSFRHLIRSLSLHLRRSILHLEQRLNQLYHPHDSIRLPMLLALPLELIDGIVENVENPRDLAALSAVCRFLKKMLSPTSGRDLGPLQCRYLSLTRKSGPSFSLLATRPMLARAIRRLLITENASIGNQYWYDQNEFNSHRPRASSSAIRAALMEMRNLQFLSCSVHVSGAQTCPAPLFQDLSM
ncbi:hypothetical protein CALVIDRAFT_540918 [Calocera viscosa TUFC12733]|uniref:F-box domain-containing protein n=1 Tax=Calocera viscosa (strain TUFC12733) TaxID=1330018 RepID=A0A167IAN8_CALVF|nr:hypothetical protein CALVIDRAFT_540918 [Calocera viscosa TUFC12733]